MPRISHLSWWIRKWVSIPCLMLMLCQGRIEISKAPTFCQIDSICWQIKWLSNLASCGCSGRRFPQVRIDSVKKIVCTVYTLLYSSKTFKENHEQESGIKEMWIWASSTDDQWHILFLGTKWNKGYNRNKSGWKCLFYSSVQECGPWKTWFCEHQLAAWWKGESPLKTNNTWFTTT